MEGSEKIMTQNPEDSINEKYKKVISQFRSLDINKNDMERCFDAFKATNYLVDYISFFLPQSTKKEPDGVSIFTCIESCADFLLVNAVAPSQIYPFFVSFLPLVMSCSKLFSLRNSCSNSEYISSWLGFKKHFLSVYNFLFPLDFQPSITSLQASLEEFVTTNPELGDIVQKFNLFLNDFQSAVESEQSNEFYKNNLQKIVSFKKKVYEKMKSVKGEDWKKCVQPQFYSAVKIFEDNLIIGSMICQLNYNVTNISNVQKCYNPNDSETEQIGFLHTALKVIVIILRFIGMQSFTEEDGKWLFECFDYVTQMQSVLTIHDGDQLNEAWNNLRHKINSCTLKICSEQEQADIEKIRSVANLYPINYPKMSSDIDKISTLYSLSCSSTNNYYVAQDLYNLLTKSMHKSTNAEFTEAVMRFRKSFTKRLLYIYFVSITDSIEPSVALVAKNENSRTALNNVSSLLETFQELSVDNPFVYNTNSYFMKQYIQYLNLIQLMAQKVPDAANSLLKFHPTPDDLSKYVTLNEEFAFLIEEITSHQECSALFVQSVKVTSSVFGTPKWIENAGAFFQYALGRNKEVQTIINNFSKIQSFLNLSKSINKQYPRDPEADSFIPRTTEESIEGIAKICELFFHLIDESFYSAEDLASLFQYIEPLFIHTLYTNYLTPEQVEETLSSLMSHLIIPSCSEHLTKFYTSIDVLTKFRMKYNKAMTIPISKMCAMMLSIVDSEFPEREKLSRAAEAIKTSAGQLAANEKKQLDDICMNVAKFFTNCLTFTQIVDIITELKHTDKVDTDKALKTLIELNQVSTIIEQLDKINNAKVILPEKAETVNDLLSILRDARSTKYFFEAIGRSMSGELKKVISQFKNTKNFIRRDFLFYFFKTLRVSLDSFISHCEKLESEELIEMLSKISDNLYNFALVGDKAALYQVEEYIMMDMSAIISKKCNCKTIFEVVLFKQQLYNFLEKVKPIRYISDIQEYPLEDRQDGYQAIISNLTTACTNYTEKVGANPSAKDNIIIDYIDKLSDISFLNFLSLGSSITAEEVSQSRLEDVKRLRDSIQKELERITELDDNFDEKMKEKVGEAQKDIDSFKHEIEKVREKQKQSIQEIEELRKEKEILEEEKNKLISIHKGTGQLRLDNEVSSVISLLLKDENQVSKLHRQPLTEADLIADQLQEALKTNLRLKKSIQVMKFPQEQPLFTPEEFAEVTAKFSEPEIRSTPFSAQYGNESTTLRQQLKDLHSERDDLFRQIVSLQKKQEKTKEYKTDELYNELVEQSKGASKRAQRDQFLEFAETSDHFFLEVSSQIKDLEEKIEAIRSGRKSEVMSSEMKKEFLLNKLNSKNIDTE